MNRFLSFEIPDFVQTPDKASVTYFASLGDLVLR
jgi:hypothetical protein